MNHQTTPSANTAVSDQDPGLRSQEVQSLADMAANGQNSRRREQERILLPEVHEGSNQSTGNASTRHTDQSEDTAPEGQLQLSVEDSAPGESHRNLGQRRRDFLEVGDDFWDSFTCRFCQNIITPPIYRCSRDHYRCNGCANSSARWNQQCRECGSNFIMMRCLAVEEILASSCVSCEYSSHGCRVQLPGDEIANHAKRCPYRPRICFVHSVCPWTSSDLIAHLQTEHHIISETVNGDAKIRFEIPYTDAELRRYCGVSIINFRSPAVTVVFEVRYDVPRRIFHMLIRDVGHQVTYKLKMMRRGKKFSHTGQSVGSYRLLADEIQDGVTVSLPIENMRGFCRVFEGRLQVMVVIQVREVQRST
eukprot:CAMPEP_0115044402 /NCGR_PEP_ID=MMETSP0216-20121206/47464_1 /TAXON_ID=223996 /ORGANISM="Protocruzia adherens, Strain Boccale" /LENGTH=362 /DNA_ID=CAMNT_0002426949 /DNA_START=194 /DNA_END=1282 /DNA_ORIENTATION=-